MAFPRISSLQLWMFILVSAATRSTFRLSRVRWRFPTFLVNVCHSASISNFRLSAYSALRWPSDTDLRIEPCWWVFRRELVLSFVVTLYVITIYKLKDGSFTNAIVRNVNSYANYLRATFNSYICLQPQDVEIVIESSEGFMFSGQKQLTMRLLPLDHQV